MWDRRNRALPDDNQTMTTERFDPTSTYLHLSGGQAEQMTVDDGFWAGVASGARPLSGWLVAMFEWLVDPHGTAGGHSEVHPKGDEVHVCVSGAMTAVLEHDDGEERIDFSAGQACVVPRGAWHRLVARESSRVLTMTFGEGTEHRPAR